MQTAQGVFQQFQRHDKDNGSPEVQIAILTHEIEMLQGHLSTNAKDVDAKRSLLKKVARRRKFLKFLKETNLERFLLVSRTLKLKG